jgi:thymidylate kinase
MIIAMDGPDGAGKSTQIVRLARWARERGLDCRVVSKWDLFDETAHPEARFLRGTTLEELRVCISEMPTPARAMFLMWLISSAANPDTAPDCDLLVIDGYWMKHAAAELAYGCDPRLVTAAGEAFPPVDAVVYLDVTPEAALARKGSDLSPYECGRDPACAPRSFLAHQRTVRERLLGWASARGWHVVDSSDMDAAQAAIRRIVSAGLRPTQVPT